MAEEIIVGLDIGTTKVCAVVGEARPDGVEIIGMGSHPSEGLRKGVVINIEHTVNSIKEAVEDPLSIFSYPADPFFPFPDSAAVITECTGDLIIFPFMIEECFFHRISPL